MGSELFDEGEWGVGLSWLWGDLEDGGSRGFTGLGFTGF